jgi:hypothetical protein
MFFSLPRGSKIFQICHDANFFTPDLTLFSKLKKYHVYWGVSFYSRSTNIILSNLVYMPSSFLPTSFCSLDSKMRRKSCPCSPFQVLWIQNCSPQMLYRLLRSASSSKSCSSSSKIHVSIVLYPCSSLPKPQRVHFMSFAWILRLQDFREDAV